jgi:hypothetical protein
MWLGRKLAEGVGGWLQLEFQCHRSEVFSEKYLSVPVGQILSAEFGTKAYAEVNHPILAKLAKGSGRRPQVDFAVCNPYPQISVAVETKWVTSSAVQAHLIIWDLIRLEMLSYHLNARTFFVFGGKKKFLDVFFRSDAFLGPLADGRSRPILSLPNRPALGLRMHQPPISRIPILRKVFKVFKMADVEMPEAIKSSKPAIFPETCPRSRYQIYAWEIMPAKHRRTFLPSSHKFYK